MDEKQVAEVMRAIQNEVAQSAETLNQHLQGVQAAIAHAASAMLPVIEGISAAAKSASTYLLSVGPALVEFTRMMDGLPNRTREALAALAARGWYLNPEMDIAQILQLVALFGAGEDAKANHELTQFFDERASSILDELISAHPARERILRAAFSAHGVGNYALSVPILLIQADGICYARVGVQLYSKGGSGRTKLGESTLAKSAEGLSAAFLHPISEVFPVAFGPSQRSNLPGEFNRHAILHGESTDYDTQVNSCKAMSLLVFTDWVLKDLKVSVATTSGSEG